MIAFCCDWCGTVKRGRFVTTNTPTADNDDDDDDDDDDESVVRYGTPIGWLSHVDNIHMCVWHACSPHCAHHIQKQIQVDPGSLN